MSKPVMNMYSETLVDIFNSNNVVRLETSCYTAVKYIDVYYVG